MSAYMHDQDHIDLIVTAASELNPGCRYSASAPDGAGYRRIEVTGRTELGRVLLAENARSVLSHYTPDDPHVANMITHCQGIVDTYEHRPVYEFVDMPDRWLVAADAIRGLRYQSCDASDYRDTDAAALLDSLEQSVVDAAIDDAGVNGWRFERTLAPAR